MKQIPFTALLASLLKPLTFAAKDNFHHIESVKGIESLVSTLCDEALAMDISPDAKAPFTGLKELFKGYDTRSRDDKEQCVVAAFEVIGEIEGGHGRLTPEEVVKGLERLMTPLDKIKGIGPRLAGRLEKKGLSSVEDMLYFFPLRYEDRRSIKKISALSVGAVEVVVGEVLALGEVFYGRRRLFEMALGDETGILKMKWFHYRLPAMKKRFKAGQRLLVCGDVSAYGGQKEIIHPDVENIDGPGGRGAVKTGIVPVYSQIDNLHQKTIRKIVGGVVSQYGRYAVGGIPPAILAKYRLMALPEALQAMHTPDEGDKGSAERPRPVVDVGRARRSVVFDEFFCLEAGLALKKAGVEREEGIAFAPGSKLAAEMTANLPFTLTDAQKRVAEEIERDMASPHPMNRLVQGDVGSGKTVVALMAVLTAVENGYQAALMAPTEILAEQHLLTVRRYIEPLGINVALVTSALTKGERGALAAEIGSGRISFVVGTHALIQDYLEFKALGLVIVDEQHRFGVVQRATLKKKGANPDILVMTATPIPRTLSMTVFGDLDVSVIDELPPGRKEIATKIFRERGLDKVYDLIRREVGRGRQAYIVYPLVEESEEMPLRDATTMKGHLEKDVFPDCTVGLLHGRMKGEEKEAVMKRFKAGEINLLVATTVIEVGIDVPNATVMLIEHAERFGLAQLHQLRGRVGRGGEKSYCLLLAAERVSEIAYKRLKIMESTTSGFTLAEEDLRLRGPGDFIGKRQSGLPDFRIANPLDDISILQQARDEAFQLVKDDSALSSSSNKSVREVIRARWKGRLELATVG